MGNITIVVGWYMKYLFSLCKSHSQKNISPSEIANANVKNIRQCLEDGEQKNTSITANLFTFYDKSYQGEFGYTTIPGKIFGTK